MLENTEIISILKEFYRISGFRVSIHDLEYNEIYAYPCELSKFCKRVQRSDAIRQRCLENDKNAFLNVKKTDTAYVYKCHCGLYEAVAPIYHFGVLSGYLMMGQIRDTDPKSLAVIRKSLAAVTTDTEESEHILSGVRAIDSDLIPCYVNIMKMVAEHITATGKINYCGENIGGLVKKFINRNYGSKISLRLLSETFGCSNSTIMKKFKDENGTTVAEYLNDVRVKNAERMLTKSRKSIKEISALCGFSDQNYFSRQFSSRYGCPPSEYRKKYK